MVPVARVVAIAFLCAQCRAANNIRREEKEDDGTVMVVVPSGGINHLSLVRKEKDASASKTFTVSATGALTTPAEDEAVGGSSNPELPMPADDDKASASLVEGRIEQSNTQHRKSLVKWLPKPTPARCFAKWCNKACGQNTCKKSSWCQQNKQNCASCSGMWCEASTEAPTPASTTPLPHTRRRRRLDHHPKPKSKPKPKPSGEACVDRSVVCKTQWHKLSCDNKHKREGCQLTCGACPACSDFHTKCPEFKSKGYCQHKSAVFKSWMGKKCQKSCRKCQTAAEFKSSPPSSTPPPQPVALPPPSPSKSPQGYCSTTITELGTCTPCQSNGDCGESGACWATVACKYDASGVAINCGDPDCNE